LLKIENQKLKKNSIKILFIGDIVGRPGRRAVREYLAAHKEADKIDLVLANGENMAGGQGFTPETYDAMIEAGVDYFTSGNHIWAKKDIIDKMKDGSVKILRPANFSDDSPGSGVVKIKVADTKIILVNIIGRVFIPLPASDPFHKAKEIVDDHEGEIIIVDFHAEATSEKIALGYYLDGKVSAVLGTHTHVQTSDETILPKGTAYITDVGMTGPKESVLGIEKDIIIKQFLTGQPQSHKVASGEAIFSAVLVEIDTSTKKAVRIDRIFETIN